MKNRNGIFKTMLLMTFVLALFSCEKEKNIPIPELPTEIANYVKTHFPEATITQGLLDRDGLKKEYEITLSDKTKLEFNSKNEIIEIKGKSELPESVLPVKIKEYVVNNYSDNVIFEWELEKKHQEVKLDNALELQFSLDGDFVKID